MAYWFWAYLVIVLALFAVAIYEQVAVARLSLPLSPALTVLTILLPLLAAVNALFYHKTASTVVSARHHSWHRGLLPAGLQVAQVLVTTVLATLLATGLAPSDVLQCRLSTRWQRMWTTHDATAIRAVQDALDCCGYNSVKDRFWPFPRGSGEHHADCATQWGRTASCARPWMQAMRASSGADFAIVFAVGLMQLASLLLVQWRRRNHSHSAAEHERTRPLLRGDETEEGRRSAEEDGTRRGGVAVPFGFYGGVGRGSAGTGDDRWGD